MCHPTCEPLRTGNKQALWGLNTAPHVSTPCHLFPHCQEAYLIFISPYFGTWRVLDNGGWIKELHDYRSSSPGVASCRESERTPLSQSFHLKYQRGLCVHFFQTSLTNIFGTDSLRLMKAANRRSTALTSLKMLNSIDGRTCVWLGGAAFDSDNIDYTLVGSSKSSRYYLALRLCHTCHLCSSFNDWFIRIDVICVEERQRVDRHFLFSIMSFNIGGWGSGSTISQFDAMLRWLS